MVNSLWVLLKVTSDDISIEEILREMFIEDNHYSNKTPFTDTGDSQVAYLKLKHSNERCNEESKQHLSHLKLKNVSRHE